LNEGLLESGQMMKVIDRTYPRWTIASANDVMFAKPRNSLDDQELAACPLLSRSWRETLRTRAESSEQENRDKERRRLDNSQ
jgi:MOSC domain-containing protein YiiM